MPVQTHAPLGEIDFVGAVKGSGEDTPKLDVTAPATFSRDVKAEIGERIRFLLMPIP